MEATAEASFALIFDVVRHGIAMAAMTIIITTTIINSSKEKPLDLMQLASYSE